MKSKKEIKPIITIKQGSGKYYLTEYEEYKNITDNSIEIVAKMKIDLNSKAAINKLNKSWKKDKSPLLTELQEIYRNHLKNIEEEKEGKIYTEIK